MDILVFLLMLFATLLGTLVFVAIANVIRYMAEHEDKEAEQSTAQILPGQTQVQI